jgi:hypothetical protein
VAARHLDRLQQLAQGEEVDLLSLVGVAVREVQRARVVHEVAGAGQVEPAPRDRLQLLQRKRRLAAARRPDHDQRQRRLDDGGLGVVERKRLVEDVDDRRGGVDVPEPFGRLGLGRGDGHEVRVRVAAAVEEAGLGVVVVADDFEDQQVAPAVLGTLEEQAVLVVEPGPVDPEILELLHLRRAEVPLAELLQHPRVLARDVPRIEVPQDEQLHRASDIADVSCLGAETRGVPRLPDLPGNAADAPV